MPHLKYPTPDFDIKLHGARLQRARRLLDDPAALRLSSEYNQQHFWRKYGTSQSAGCRYEREGHQVPKPVRMLLLLETLGHVPEAQLIEIALLAERVDEIPGRGGIVLEAWDNRFFS
ncbi:hypothetical protein [Denitromonas iodatirespirans]|uniref:RsaL-like HTH domain-containing protein n=1 Tax=Denitromonas iodatirespirans TaxID=2795389 RepID=A0A944HG33_DENI1|nr:hypothetical protein [Denitromonas iodatirespirans]MBT0964241.1 hypothetical protein [Denitromonas iodatirespirans]